MPTWAPVRNAIFIAGLRPSLWAAEATRTFAPHRQPHTQIADQGGQHRAAEEGHGPSDPQGHGTEVVARVHREQEQEEEGGDSEHTQGPELPAEVRACALLHRDGDHLHVGGAVMRRQDLPAEDHGHHQGDDRNDADNGDERQVSA
jgi:hypothetical protein